jgi:CheY-like chemotaxis protein
MGRKSFARREPLPPKQQRSAGCILHRLPTVPRAGWNGVKKFQISVCENPPGYFAVCDVTQFMSPSSIDVSGVIVAVDDDADDVDLLRLLLRKAGIDQPIQIYRHGEDLIAALSNFAKDSFKSTIRPLLCFLDIKMPAMTGHDVLKWIRAQPALDPVPVVILSSSDHPSDIKQAAEAGAQCYLAKYPQPGVLKEIVHEAERFALGAPADECFRMPTNLLLVRGRRV